MCELVNEYMRVSGSGCDNDYISFQLLSVYETKFPDLTCTNDKSACYENVATAICIKSKVQVLSLNHLVYLCSNILESVDHTVSRSSEHGQIRC